MLLSLSSIYVVMNSLSEDHMSRHFDGCYLGRIACFYCICHNASYWKMRFYCIYDFMSIFALRVLPFSVLHILPIFVLHMLPIFALHMLPDFALHMLPIFSLHMLHVFALHILPVLLFMCYLFLLFTCCLCFESLLLLLLSFVKCVMCLLVVFF